jgi:hypothetical protein
VLRKNRIKSLHHTMILNNNKEKSRVPRELRNLISNVNYDGGSTRRTTSASGRALMLSQ